jgi:hypothetical protein
MWAVAAPVAFVAVAFVVRRVVASAGVEKSSEHDDTDTTCTSVVVESDVIESGELMEAGVPVITDLVNWLDEGAERLAIKRKPVLMRVQNGTGDAPSVCLDFAAGAVDFKLWIAGPSWMGPYPRLTRSESTDKSIVLEERTSVCLERAVTALQIA